MRWKTFRSQFCKSISFFYKTNITFFNNFGTTYYNDYQYLPFTWFNPSSAIIISWYWIFFSDVMILVTVFWRRLQRLEVGNQWTGLKFLYFPVQGKIQNREKIKTSITCIFSIWIEKVLYWNDRTLNEEAFHYRIFQIQAEVRQVILVLNFSLFSLFMKNQENRETLDKSCLI